MTCLNTQIIGWIFLINRRIGIITGLFDRKSEYRIRSVAGTDNLTSRDLSNWSLVSRYRPAPFAERTAPKIPIVAGGYQMPAQVDFYEDLVNKEGVAITSVISF